MPNGEDLPPAWTENDTEHRQPEHTHCRECDVPIVTNDGPYCDECRKSRYFTMG